MATTRIASIHFAPVIERRMYRGAPYEMPAVPLGADPAILECFDLMQRDEGPVSSGPGNGRRQQLAYEVLGEEQAADMIIAWAQSGPGMTPDCCPGIWVVRDRIPLMKHDKDDNVVPVLDFKNKQSFRPATPEESAEMWAEDLVTARRVDRAYAEWCYAEGNRIAADDRLVQFIAKNFKLAAHQYGFEAPWTKAGGTMEMRPCPQCHAIIGKSAMICRYCSQPVDLVRWARYTAEKDAALATAAALVAAPHKTQKAA